MGLSFASGRSISVVNMTLGKSFVLSSFAFLLLSEHVWDVAAAYVSTCSFEPTAVGEGENATLTCNLAGPQVSGMKIQRTELNKTHQIDDDVVLECTLFEGQETFTCTKNMDGYLPVNSSGNPFGVLIVNASTYHEASYVCEPVPGIDFDVIPCNFTLSDTKNDDTAEISKLITIGVPVGAVVVIVVIAVAVFVYCR